jgi:hypothetical protein
MSQSEIQECITMGNQGTLGLLSQAVAANLTAYQAAMATINAAFTATSSQPKLVAITPTTAKTLVNFAQSAKTVLTDVSYDPNAVYDPTAPDAGASESAAPTNIPILAANAAQASADASGPGIGTILLVAGAGLAYYLWG